MTQLTIPDLTALPSQYLWILVELDKHCIRTKDPNNHSDTETGTLSGGWQTRKSIFIMKHYLGCVVIVTLVIIHSVPQSAAGLHLSNSPEMSGRGCQVRLISATFPIKIFLIATMSLTIITTSTTCQGWLSSGHQSLGFPRHVSSSGN